MNEQTKIAQLNKFLFDVKAEVAVGHWFEKAFINEKQLFVKFEGQHERGVGKDIKKVNIIDSKKGRFDRLVDLSLNRDSLYDTMPEVLFHYPKKRTKRTGADTMAEDYRTRKVEERTARTFFNPFDQAFFFQKALIEQQEASVLDKFNQFGLDDEYYDFLYIDSSLPFHLKIRLLCFLPYLDKIIGNFKLTEICLSLLIDYEVKWKTFYSTLIREEDKSFRLGNERLGVDFIVGNTIETTNQNIVFNIGPIPKNELLNFIHTGYYVRFFEIFSNYFLPLEVDSTFKINVAIDENKFQLNQITTIDSRLNYTTFL